jgi:hypothetical protein
MAGVSTALLVGAVSSPRAFCSGDLRSLEWSFSPGNVRRQDLRPAPLLSPLGIAWPASCSFCSESRWKAAGPHHGHGATKSGDLRSPPQNDPSPGRLRGYPLPTGEGKKERKGCATLVTVPLNSAASNDSDLRFQTYPHWRWYEFSQSLVVRFYLSRKGRGGRITVRATWRG